MFKIDELTNFIAKRTALANGDTDWDLAQYHIGNLLREDDRTTKEFYSRYDNAKDNPDLPLYVILFRVVNFLPSLADITCRGPFTRVFIENYCRYLNSYSSLGMFSTIVPIYSHTYDVGRVLELDLFKPILANKEAYINLLQTGTPKDIIRLLQSKYLLGSIVGAEVLLDMLYIREHDMPYIDYPNTFYTRQALNYLKGISLNALMPKAIVDEHIDEIANTVFNGTRYQVSRILHLFGRHYINGINTPYIPKRAITFTRPSFINWCLKHDTTN